MKQTILKLISFYQKYLSFPEVLSILSGAPKNCRFYPSCADYTHQAIKRHGAIKGLAFGVWRVLRCNPLNPGGFDPVPDAKKEVIYG